MKSDSAKILVFAVIYYVTQKLSLFLMWEPGAASLLWPIAGICLAAVYVYGYKLLWGVFFGAMVSSLRPDAIADLSVLSIIFRGVLLSIGPVLQAFVGVCLLRKLIGTSTRLETVSDIVKFNVFGGLVACVVASTCAVTSAYILGNLPPAGIFPLWTTWYIGDVLGVLLVAPVLILFLQRNPNITLQRRMTVLVPFLIVFVISVVLLNLVLNIERENAQENLNTNASLFSKELDLTLKSFVDDLYALQGFVYAEDILDQDKMRYFVASEFHGQGAIETVFWAPRVLRGQRRAFEKRRRPNGQNTLQIKKMTDQKELIYQASQYSYYPVTLATQKYERSHIYGYDLYSNQAMLQAIARAREEGRVQIIRSPYVLSGYNAYGALLLLPVYEYGIREQNTLRGVLGMVVHYDKILNTLSQDIRKKGIHLTLAPSRSVPYTAYSGASDDYLKKHVDMAYGNIVLSLVFKRQNDSGSGFVIMALCAGLVSVFIISGFILVVSGQVAVTEQIVAERTRALQDSRNFLKLMMDSVPDFVFVKNRALEIVDANKAFLSIYPPNQREGLIGRTGLEAFPKKDREVYEREDNKAFDLGYTETYENNIDYTGRVRRVFTKKHRFVDDYGHEYILGISRDMTDFLLTQNKLQAIFDNTADGLMSIKENGIIESYNKACINILGFKLSESAGQHVQMLEPVKEEIEDGQEPFNYQKHIVDAQSGETHEVYVKHKSGAVFPIALSVTHINVGGQLYYNAILRDISQEKQAREELKRSNRELEAFAYVASHDLKAPLRHISMSAEFLQREYENTLNPSGKELLGVLVKSSKRMSKMIESLLSYSRVGRDGRDMEAVDVQAALDDAQTIMTYELEKKAGKVVVKGTLPKVMGNRELLAKLFQNLIDNALKYAKPDENPVIEVTCRTELGYHVIRFADNGIGIAKEHQERVFSIFQRLNKEADADGTGVGLSICKRIVEIHHGEIYIDEYYDMGACFVIKLPVT